VLPLAPACSGAFDTDWMASAAEQHVDALPTDLRPLAPLLAELVPSAGPSFAAVLTTPDSEAAMATLGSDTDAALCALAVAVLRPVLAGNAAVLLADDASSLDDRSVALLVELHATLRPALLLTLPRAELEDPQSGGARLVAALAQRATTCRAVALGPLSPAAAGELCASELGVHVAALPAGLVPAMTRLAGGQPLLLKEQLALLQRQGHLRIDSDSREVHADVTTLPDVITRGLTDGSPRMEIFLQRRLDALSPDARAAVRASAVLDGDWDASDVAHCCGAHFTFATACAAAAELVHAGVWAHAQPDGDDDDAGGSARYTFASEVVRSLVFAATPEDARAELHAAVLARMQERAGSNPQQSAATWAEWARLAHGAKKYAAAASLFLAAALSSQAARELPDAAHAAHDGLASLRAAAAHAGGSDEPKRHTGRMSQQLAAAAPRASVANRRSAALARSSSHTDINPLHSQLWRDLCAVLHTVRHVRTSWKLVQPGLEAHAPAMTNALVSRCPSVLHLVRSRHGLLLNDPVMGPVMTAHQVTLLTLIGSVVAGGRDLAALSLTLVACGRMHTRFSDHMRDFLPGCGLALRDTLRGELGLQAFSPDVEAAWAGAYDWVAQRLLQGVDSAQAAVATEHALRSQLLRG
jgi:hypothetical protein